MAFQGMYTTCEGVYMAFKVGIRLVRGLTCLLRGSIWLAKGSRWLLKGAYSLLGGHHGF
jgi:hypothetical protein